MESVLGSLYWTHLQGSLSTLYATCLPDEGDHVFFLAIDIALLWKIESEVINKIWPLLVSVRKSLLPTSHPNFEHFQNFIDITVPRASNKDFLCPL